MKLYLAGQRTGLPDYNREAFEYGAERLRGEGHEVISPVELDGADEGMVPGGDGSPLPEDVYLRGLRKCVAAMLGCEAVAVMGEWEKSRGATLEVTVARMLGLPIYRVTVDGYDQVHLAAIPAESHALPGTVLAEAESLVNGARKGIYGHPAEFGTKVAGAWSAAFGWEVNAFRVQLAMILFKAIRADSSPDHRDNLTDVAGYSRSAEAVQAREGVPGFLDLDAPSA